MTTAAPASPAEDWIVLKFGGTSVSERTRWDQIGARIGERRAEGVRVLTVVSALSGVTNALQAIADARARNDEVAAATTALLARHRAFAATLDLDADAVLGDLFAGLASLSGDARRRLADDHPDALRWQAELLAHGELLSSRLGVAYLSARGLPIGWCDARRWLQAQPLPNQNAWSQRLAASCGIAADGDWRARFAAQGPLLLTQGFIASDPQGATVLLGRGGSDTSAACFGALLGARRVEIWTDVPGMFSANPRAVPQARLLRRLDYEEAQEIATTGAKVLHPRCISPCREAGVPLWIRDTEHPDLAGTEIDGTAAPVAGVKAISSRRGIVLVSMESIGMWQQVGFLADVFAIFKQHGLSVDLIGSSETNVTVSLDPSDNLVSSNVLSALCGDLAGICRVKAIAPCAAITLVGRGMRSLLHRLSGVLASFGRERVHLISQSSNDLNLTFVVDEALADGMLPHLHELLVHSGAMPISESRVFGPSWKRLHAPAGDAAPPWWQARRADLLARAATGTPRYVYHLPTVRARARELVSLPAVDRCFYALKANPHPGILRALDEAGFGFECVSAGEIEHLFASVADLDPDAVLFTPSFAPVSEYATAFARGVRVTIDNIALLRAEPALFAGRPLILRVDPGFGHGHHEKVRTGGREAKFGLAIDAVPALVEEAQRVGARIVGLHAHIGSGIVDPGHWRTVYALLAALADGIGTVESIDVGGGLGVAYEPDAESLDLAAYGAALAGIKAAYPQYRLWIEPGRFLVAEAGALLLSVTQVAEKAGVRRVGADGGMNVLLRPALYGAWHGIVNLSRGDAEPGADTEVVGPICETGDVLGSRRPLPDATAPGDVLLVEHAGAYGAVMASRYNLRALPVEELLDD
jgi:bifunctional diaminopimelate decarboxylase / aspartate kinase